MNIEESDGQRIQQRMRDGNNRLRLPSELLSDIMDRSGMMLTGAATMPRGVPLAELDLIAAMLLARMGVHPAAASALSQAAAGIGIENDDGDVIAEILGPAGNDSSPFWVQSGPLRWGSGFLEVPELPASVVSALCDGGQTALASIVSHPTLDPLGLTIRWALEGSNDGTTALVVNHDPAALDRRAMNAVWKAHRP